MSSQTATIQPVLRHEHRPFHAAPLACLIERIACAADRQALCELQNHRTPCRLGNRPPLTVLRFIVALFEMSWVYRLCGHDQMVVERARDLTNDKFSRLRSQGDDAGSDCRTSYAGVLRTIRAWNTAHPRAHALELEAAAACILQRSIQCHVRFSSKEARRYCNPLRSRFAWRLSGGTIHVWIPTSLGGKRRRKWLEENIPDPDPSRPSERQRVQSIIDDRLGVPRVVELPSDSSLGSTRRGDDPAEMLWLEDDPEPIELGEVVAEEKAQRINQLRPSIQALGPARLRELIVHIFRRLANDEYDQKELAAAYPVKEPTLSRFAGKNWDDVSSVPDLWVNTAQVLAGDERYVEAAIEAGVWSNVRTVLDNHRAERKGGDKDGQRALFHPDYRRGLAAVRLEARGPGSVRAYHRPRA